MRVKNEGKNEGQKLVSKMRVKCGSKMRDKNLSDQGNNSYIYQMCKCADIFISHVCGQLCSFDIGVMPLIRQIFVPHFLPSFFTLIFDPHFDPHF